MVLLIAFALVAAACSSDSSDSGDTETTTSAAGTTETTVATDTTETTEAAAATTTTEAKLEHPYGGEAIAGQDQEPPTLNSFAPGGDNTTVAVIGQAYYTGVQDISGFTLELIPEVVTELPNVENGGVVVNDDGTMTVKYNILDAAVWEDGTPISGADFMMTYDLIMDPELAIFQAIYEDILPESVAFGDKTFEYTLAAPTAQYDLLFDTVVPSHQVVPETFFEDWNDKMWLSGGPFIFSEWAVGEFITVTKNENYWKTDPDTGQQLPYLDSVTWKFIPETESLINAFKARELDIINPPPSAEGLQTMQALEPEGARVEALSGPIWEHLNWQYGPARFEKNANSCNENYNMRLATALSIDKRLIVDEILAGQVEPMESYVQAFAPGLSNESWSQYSPSTAGAKDAFAAALEETGKECEVVFTTTSNNDARVKLSELFVGMFEASGIPYSNSLEDSSVFFGETLDNGQWDLGEWAWSGSSGLSGLVSVHELFDPEKAPPVGQNSYRWGSYEDDYDYSGDSAIYEGTNESSIHDEATARYTEIVVEMNSTVDEAEIVTLIQEAEALLADNLMMFPLYQRLDAGTVWADEIGNFKHNPTQANYTWNMEMWFRTDLEG
jgi:peptide/nickel transport system substrate-binding protein